MNKMMGIEPRALRIWSKWSTPELLPQWVHFYCCRRLKAKWLRLFSQASLPVHVSWDQRCDCWDCGETGKGPAAMSGTESPIWRSGRVPCRRRVSPCAAFLWSVKSHPVLWVFGKQERGFQGKIRVQFWDLSNLRFFTYPTTLWLQKSSKFSSPTKPEPPLVTNRKTNSKSSFTLSCSVKQIRREGATLF